VLKPRSNQHTIHQPRYLEKALWLLKNVLEKRLLIQGEDNFDTLTSMQNVGLALLMLKRYEESLPIFEQVVEKRSIILGEFHEAILRSMHSLAVVQINLGRLDQAQRTASRGLLLAQQVGNEELADSFDETLSNIGEVEQDVDPNATDEQKTLREKIRVRKEEAVGHKMAMAEAASVATPGPPMSDADINALMLEFDNIDGGGKKKSSGGGNATTSAG
jgi:tetratricopeptide (TPR) repeat protein